MIIFHNSINFLYSKGRFNTPERLKMALLESALNGFYLLTNFVKLSILDVCRVPRNPSIWWIYVTKSSNLDPILDSRPFYTTDTMVLFFKKTILHKNTFRAATNTIVFFSEIPKHNVTWSASSIFCAKTFYRFHST